MLNSSKRSTTGSTTRRVIGVVGVVLASQVLTACVVVPVPHRSRAVVVQPGYSGPPPGHYRNHDRYPDRRSDRDWRR